MEALRDTAMMISAHIATIDGLNVITDGSAIPVLSFNCDDDLGFTVFDISHELRALGFQVPAYTMPADAENVAVLRVVVREGFSRDMAYKLGLAIEQVVEHLKAGARPQATKAGFAH